MNTELRYIAKGRHAAILGERDTIKMIWEGIKKLGEEEKE